MPKVMLLPSQLNFTEPSKCDTNSVTAYNSFKVSNVTKIVLHSANTTFSLICRKTSVTKKEFYLL